MNYNYKTVWDYTIILVIEIDSDEQNAIIFKLDDPNGIGQYGIGLAYDFTDGIFANGVYDFDTVQSALNWVRENRTITNIR